MNQYVTGAVIKELREKNKMTQLQLADLIHRSSIFGPDTDGETLSGRKCRGKI